VSVTEPRVSPAVDRLAAYAWRLLVIAAAVVAAVWLLGELRAVVFALVVAIFLTRALVPVAIVLRRRGLPSAVAAALALFAFIAVLVGAIWLIVPAVADEFASLGPTVSEALDDVDRWIVEDSGLDLTQADVDRARERIGEQLGSLVNVSGGSIAAGAVFVAEGLAGLVIAVFLTFFLLKDGERFQRWCLSFLPAESQPRARRLSARSWAVLGGYLRGAAILGLLEGTIMAATLTLVGGSLALPVAIITFLAAFVPFVGAIVAGVIAVLVALASAGLPGAAIVAVVAVAVQQLDNDLLAPIVYGHALQLHPAAIILSVAAGGALFGVSGTFLAVPVAAVIGAIVSELRSGGEPVDREALPAP
jgi:putative heme transporter